jgi:hypothetical protein
MNYKIGKIGFFIVIYHHGNQINDYFFLLFDVTLKIAITDLTCSILCLLIK